jgi:hypothetical protein
MPLAVSSPRENFSSVSRLLALEVSPRILDQHRIDLFLRDTGLPQRRHDILEHM